ncbi:MAG: hypothetical protein AMXMBFR84_23540 [Candidatus Hydrogenedentota bacterium]
MGEDSMKQALAVVVPCYNAGNKIRPVIEKALQVLPTIIVVDDGSTDGAPQSLHDLPVRVLHLSPNQGKGFAMIAGFREALTDSAVTCVAILDADGQHDPAELPRLYDVFDSQKADLVIGSRSFDQAHVPLRSRLGNKLTARLTGILLGQQVQDTQSGFRLHSRTFLDYILSAVPGGRYDTEMEILVRAVRKGYKVAACPIQTIYETGNPTSHFNKFRDSYRIYKRLLVTSLRRD